MSILYLRDKLQAVMPTLASGSADARFWIVEFFASLYASKSVELKSLLALDSKENLVVLRKEMDDIWTESRECIKKIPARMTTRQAQIQIEKLMDVLYRYFHNFNVVGLNVQNIGDPHAYLFRMAISRYFNRGFIRLRRNSAFRAHFDCYS
jgi:hypothetical protein